MYSRALRRRSRRSQTVKDTRPTTSCLNDGEHDFNGGDCSWPYCLCPRYDAIPTATAAADMSGSDTPRCDAYEIRDGIRYVSVPRSDLPNWSDFARQLECEVAEYKAGFAAANELADLATRELAQSQARCAEVEKDSARYRFLRLHRRWAFDNRHLSDAELDAAIDAALKEPR